jgi:hypothetical protein
VLPTNLILDAETQWSVKDVDGRDEPGHDDMKTIVRRVS